MRLSTTSELQRELKRIKRKDPNLLIKTQERFEMFDGDSSHPSLRNHRLKGNLRNTWSISVTGELRMLYFTVDEMAVFFKIGTHKEVYK